MRHVARGKGNAGDWSIGDAQRDQENIEAATVRFRETGRAGYGSDKDEAERVAMGLRAHATEEKNGARVIVRNTGGRRNPDWTVIVEVPK